MEAERLLTILKTYDATSGQEINLSKSEVFFSRNMSGAVQEDLSRIIGVRHVMGTGKYLGLPSMIGRDKRSVFFFYQGSYMEKNKYMEGTSIVKGRQGSYDQICVTIYSFIHYEYLSSSEFSYR